MKTRRVLSPTLLTPGEASRVLGGWFTGRLAKWSMQGKLTAIYTPGGHRRYLESEIRALAQKLEDDERRGYAIPGPEMLNGSSD